MKMAASTTPDTKTKSEKTLDRLFSGAPSKKNHAAALPFHFLAFFFFFACIFVICPCRTAAAQEETGSALTLKIASEGARPPYNYLDNNELAGFEIDLGHELCARMHLTCKFVTQEWDQMIPGLLAHQYDAIMAAFEITDDARAKIAFTRPYVRMPSAMMAIKGRTFKDLAPLGLGGKTIGVETGGAHQAFAEALYTKSEIRPYATLEEAILDLAEGRVDIVLGDKDALTDFMKTRREAQCCALVATIPRDPVFFGEGIGIGLRKEDQALKLRFEKALDSVKQDGTFAKISKKYFDFEIN